MGNENKTKFVIEAEAKGFDGVQKIVDEIVGTVGSVGNKPSAFQHLDKALASIAGSLSKIDRLVNEIERGARHMGGGGAGGAGGGGGGTGGSGGRHGHGGSGSGLLDPGFLRGLLQGVGVAQYLPGTSSAMQHQTAGNLTGRALAGAGRAATGSVFGGVQGFIEGISTIPYVGGVAAAAMSPAVQAAQDAMTLEQAKLDATPYFRGGLGGSTRSTAYEEVFTKSYDANVSPTARRTQELHNTFDDTLSRAKPLYVETTPDGFTVTDPAPFTSVGDSKAAAMAHATASRATLGYGLGSIGEAFGLSSNEAVRAATELSKASGGRYGGGLAAALGARNLYGVELSTSGSIMHGGRIGALSGSSDTDVLTQAVGRARGLGLEGSDVQEDLSRMASAIQRFATEGIPIAGQSRNAIARQLIGSGMSAPVAAGRAQRFVESVQSRAIEGTPDSALDFAATTYLGGYGGGGAEDMFKALRNMRSGNFAEGGMDKLTKLFAAQIPTGPEGRTEGIFQGYRKLGLNLSSEEAEALRIQAEGGELSPELEAAAKAARSRFGGNEDLAGNGAALTPEAVRRKARIANKKTATGYDVLDTVQTFEERSADATKALIVMTTALGALNPLLDKAVEVLQKLTDNAPTRN